MLPVQFAFQSFVRRLDSCGNSISFLFQLFKKDCEILKSQIATSSSNWHTRLVFTEHDVLQNTNVPNSGQANEMTFTNETLSPNPTVKDFLIVREKAKMNRDNPIGVACRNFRQTSIPLYLVQGCVINNALQVLSSSAEPTIRDSRIVQNAITPRLCAGMYFYSIASVVRKFLTTALAHKHLNSHKSFCSVIRKFRRTDVSLNKVYYSHIKKNMTSRNALQVKSSPLLRKLLCH